MEQIPHQLIGSFSPIIIEGFIHPMLVILTMGKLGYIHLVIMLTNLTTRNTSLMDGHH